jgi:hypothetical protein
MTKEEYLDNLFFTPLNDSEDSIYKELSTEGPRKKMVGGIYSFLVELDRYAKRGIEGKTIAEPNYLELMQEYEKTVQNMRLFDLKYSSEEWFNEKLMSYLIKIFEIRYKVEKKLN